MLNPFLTENTVFFLKYRKVLVKFDIRNGALTHFHYKIVNSYFYIHYGNSLQVTPLSIFQNFWVNTNLNQKLTRTVCR